MKFLVDVNASGSLVDGLMRLGHDVTFCGGAGSKNAG